MNHIHYLSDNLTICQKPHRLGYDFVVQGTQPGDESCKVCSALLFAHNLREYEREQRPHIYMETRVEDTNDSFTKGLLVGIPLSLLLWIAVYVIFQVTF